MSKRLRPSFFGRLFRFVIAAGSVLTVAGILTDVAPLNLPLQWTSVTGGLALACLGGGLVMVAAISLVGYRLFADETRAKSTQDASQT